MRVSTSMIYRHGLNAMQQQQSSIAKSQRQIASGKRILSPSDDPVGAQRVLDLQRSLGLNQRHQQNAERAAQRLAIEEFALDGVVTALQRIRELAVQSNNDTQTAADRRAIALEVEEHLDGLLSLANTQDGNGEFLFAGNASHTRPFNRLAGGGIAYRGDDGQRRLPIGPDYQVTVGDAGSDVFMTIPNGNGTFVMEANSANTGEGVIDVGTVVDPALWASSSQTYTIMFNNPPDTFELVDNGTGSSVTRAFVSGEAITFDGIEVAISGQPAAGDRFFISPSADQDLFQTVQSLIDGLKTAGDDSGATAKLHNAVNRFLADVDQSMDRMGAMRAEIGARLNATENQQRANEDFALQMTEAISIIRDVDYAEAISRFHQQLTALQAAQQSFLRVQDLSLFRFL